MSLSNAINSDTAALVAAQVANAFDRNNYSDDLSSFYTEAVGAFLSRISEGSDQFAINVLDGARAWHCSLLKRDGRITASMSRPRTFDALDLKNLIGDFEFALQNRGVEAKVVADEFTVYATWGSQPREWTAQEILEREA
jgi:hypothetical protein